MLDLEVVAQPSQAEDRPPVPGFTGWWDASDHGSLQLDAGQTVAAWNDKSGGARHLTQATAGTRPWSGGPSQNGRNVVFSTGKQSNMAGPSPQSGQPYSVFTVGAQTVGDGAQRTMWVMRVAAGEGRVYRNTADDILLYLAASLASGRKWERNRPHVITSIFNGASSQVGVDGRYSVTGNLGAQGDASWTIFGMPGSEAWFGWIGEIVAYARLVTASEIERTEQYLVRKWGIR